MKSQEVSIRSRNATAITLHMELLATRTNAPNEPERTERSEMGRSWERQMMESPFFPGSELQYSRLSRGGWMAHVLTLMQRDAC